MKDKFVAQARRVGAAGLTLCSSGNLSWRVAEDEALVSSTGSWLPELTADKVTRCRISDGAVLEGLKPSMESTFHLGVMRARPEVNVVLHFQSEYATAVACMKKKPTDFNVTAEVPCYLGREIPVLPYFRPGSPELAVAVTEAMRSHDCILLGNHGQVVCGRDFDDAFQKAMFFEMACRIIVQAGAGNYNTLADVEIDDLDKYVLGKQQ
jgi:ribulose-5-phosphate 4-epimerase/fuculose-1-phosphate aldolase